MSKKFLTPVQLPSGATNPTVSGSGTLFFNTTLGSLVVYNGTEWVTLSAAGSGDIDGGLVTVGYWFGGSPSTVTFDTTYDGGSPSTTEFSATYDGGAPDTTEFA